MLQHLNYGASTNPEVVPQYPPITSQHLLQPIMRPITPQLLLGSNSQLLGSNPQLNFLQLNEQNQRAAPRLELPAQVNIIPQNSQPEQINSAVTSLLQNLGSDLSNDSQLELLKEQENFVRSLNEKKRKLSIKDKVAKFKKQRMQLAQDIIIIQKEILNLEEKPENNDFAKKLEELLTNENLKEIHQKDQCPICQEEIFENFTALMCLHKFCTPCLKAWIHNVMFNWSKGHVSLHGCMVLCPICKRAAPMQVVKKIIPESFEIQMPDDLDDANFDFWVMMQDLVRALEAPVEIFE